MHAATQARCVVFRYGRDEICPTSQRERRREPINARDDLAPQGSFQKCLIDRAKIQTMPPSDDMVPLRIEFRRHNQISQRMIATHHADIAI